MATKPPTSLLSAGILVEKLSQRGELIPPGPPAAWIRGRAAGKLGPISEASLGRCQG